MVGDVGQKLFDRKHNLSELGMIEERVRVRGNYRMYRSPRLIARIAWAFLRQDRFIAHELREQEYEDSIKSKNTLLTQPVFKLYQTREELLKEICDDIANLVTFRARPEQVLCIGRTGTLELLNERFYEQNIPVCQAKEISLDERRVVLADFISSKGLERDYVYILDVDYLQDGSLNNASLFSSSEVLEQEARRSRIKIFVALTRAVREVYLYYTNGHSRFIRELLELAEGHER